MINDITSIEEVKEFARLLVAECANFHPDDDFLDYVIYKTNLPMYTKEEAKLRNSLMKQCFEICEKEGKDIYEIMNHIFLVESGLSRSQLSSSV